jgi:uncharacterized membrane protein
MKTVHSSTFLPLMPKSLLISIAALMTALVAVLTAAFQIYVPFTQGYFNLGEVGVFITAILFGPIIGAVAGGVGSMMADIATGYVHYALATLVIKGAEGFIVGYLSWIFRGRFSSNQLRYLGIGLGFGLAACLIIIGVLRFSGELEWSGGGSTLPWWLIPFFLPSWAWIIFGLIFGSITLYITLRYDTQAAWSATAMLVGGGVMISGYFLFQLVIFQYAAFAELPFNFMQVVIGIMVALPISERLFPTVKNLGWKEES